MYGSFYVGFFITYYSLPEAMNINGKNGLACLLYIEPSLALREKGLRSPERATSASRRRASWKGGGKEAGGEPQATCCFSTGDCSTRQAGHRDPAPAAHLCRQGEQSSEPCYASVPTLMSVTSSPACEIGLPCPQDLVPDLTNFYNQ